MNILLPVDGSGCSLRAAEEVVRLLAEWSEPPVVHLLQVHLPIPIGRVQAHVGADTLHAYYREESEAAMAEAGRLLAAKGVAYTAHVHVGQPAEVIAKVAEELAARMIVMGTHGRTGVVGLVMGSVASRVVHLAPCPVLLIK